MHVQVLSKDVLIRFMPQLQVFIRVEVSMAVDELLFLVLDIRKNVINMSLLIFYFLDLVVPLPHQAADAHRIALFLHVSLRLKNQILIIHSSHTLALQMLLDGPCRIQSSHFH